MILDKIICWFFFKDLVCLIENVFLFLFNLILYDEIYKDEKNDIICNLVKDLVLYLFFFDDIIIEKVFLNLLFIILYIFIIFLNKIFILFLFFIYWYLYGNLFILFVGMLNIISIVWNFNLLYIFFVDFLKNVCNLLEIILLSL